jgi:hypothetical protein
MNLLAAETEVRARTNQDLLGTDGDLQPVKSSTIRGWINLKYISLRRRLAQVAPTLFSRMEEFTLTTGNSIKDLTDFDGFERIRRLERKVGTRWVRCDPADPVEPDGDDIMRAKYGGSGHTFLERGTNLEIYPVATAAGTYRLTFIIVVDELSAIPSDINDEAELVLPPGFENVVIEEVCALVRIRFDDDPSPHLAAAATLEEKFIPPLRRRYGVGNSPGLI